jgi:hypothetical protein
MLAILEGRKIEENSNFRRVLFGKTEVFRRWDEGGFQEFVSGSARMAQRKQTTA